MESQNIISGDDATFEETNRFWYDDWKTGFAWLEEANTLKIAADKMLRDYLAANKNLETLLAKSFPETAAYDKTKKVLTSKIDDNYLKELDNPDLSLHAVYMLLAGYAIENLFKGILICRAYLKNPQSIDKDDFWETHLGRHGLVYFADAKTFGGEQIELGLKFNAEEREVMKTLDKMVMWGGRYPIPKKYAPKNPNEKYKFTDKLSGKIPFESPYPIINHIYDKAATELKELSIRKRDAE